MLVPRTQTKSRSVRKVLALMVLIFAEITDLLTFNARNLRKSIPLVKNEFSLFFFFLN